MTNDLTPYKFSANGKPFVLQMFLSFKNKNTDKTESYYLHTANIQLFYYTQQLNELFLTGKLKYEDRFGVLDKALDEEMVFIDVVFGEYITKKDGDVSIEYIQKDAFSHKFLIKNINLNRDENNPHIIIYELDLISYIWLNLIQTAQYSGSETNEDIFKIIQQILNNLSIIDSNNKPLFTNLNNVYAGTKIKYITNGQDSILDVVDYLLSKTYYYHVKSNCLKFLIYDYYNHEIKAFDMNSFGAKSARYNTFITFSNQLERMASNGQQVYLGTVNRFPRTLKFVNKFERKISTYDYSSNEFNYENSISRKELAKFNANNDIAGNVKPNYSVSQSYWNNNLNVYKNAFDSYINGDALVINSKGNLKIQVGDQETIIIEDQQEYNGDNQNDEDVFKKYSGLAGLWNIGKVVNLISPKEESYRQNLTLFKNEDISV